MTDNVVFQTDKYIVKLEGRNPTYNVYNLLGEICITRNASAIAFWEIENFLEEN